MDLAGSVGSLARYELPLDHPSDQTEPLAVRYGRAYRIRDQARH